MIEIKQKQKMKRNKNQKDERQKLLQLSNNMGHEYPRDICIHEMFEAQVKHNSKRTAIVFEGESLSYGELNKYSNQLARYLVKHGIKTESLVGLCIERSLEMIIGILGILKAGAAYVPLDPSYPSARITEMLKDSAAAWVIGKEEQAHSIRFDEQKVIAIDDITVKRDMASYSDLNLAKENLGLSSSNLAYVIYTSGSTGKPKGVMIEHKGLVNLAHYQRDRFSIDQHSHVLQFSSLSFDASTFEWMAALCHGGQLFIIPRELVLSPRELETYIKNHQITHTNLVPSVLKSINPKCFSKTAHVISVGEQLTDDIKKRFAGHCYFYNGYGPTEVTVASSYFKVEPDTDKIAIGKPLYNVKTYVVDEFMQLSPMGVPGELLIGGEGLARGYLCQVELTQEKFINDLFSEETGARLYRTGDLVRWLPNGNLEFLSRIDRQIKLRGFRIELAEIEDRLREQSGIKDALITVPEKIQGPKQLVAFLITNLTSDHGTARIIENCKVELKQQLPDYMVPSTWHVLKTWPLLPNGKINQSALSILSKSRKRETDYVAPQTDREQTLCDIWSSVLSIEDVGLTDNFFALGGDSITAGIIISKIEEEYKFRLKIKSLFANPDIKSLSKFLKTQSSNVKLQFIKKRPPQYSSKLQSSVFQNQILFSSQTEGDNKSYHAKAAINFHGNIDYSKLKTSLKTVVQRHEIYRTYFTKKNGQYIQNIKPQVEFEIPVFDISEMSLPDKKRSIDELLDVTHGGYFDINAAPLARWVIVKITSSISSLLHIEHHLVHDGWSFNLFLKELLAVYNNNTVCSELRQYGDFVVSQEIWLYSSEAEQQLNYWITKLENSPVETTLPADYSREMLENIGVTKRIAVSRKLWDKLDDLSLAFGVTKFSILLSAMFILVSRYTEKKDLLIGTGSANRKWQDSKNIMGMFVNALVIRSSIDFNNSIKDFLKAINNVCLEALDNEEIPFESVVNQVNPSRKIKLNPFFQIMFAFHDSILPDLSCADAEVGIAEALENNGAKFDMTIVVIPRKGQYGTGDPVHFVWNYNASLYNEETINKYIEHFFSILDLFAYGNVSRIQDIMDHQLKSTKDKNHQFLGDSFLEWLKL